MLHPDTAMLGTLPTPYARQRGACPPLDWTSQTREETKVNSGIRRHLCKPTAGDTGEKSLRNTFGKFLRILLTELKEQTGRLQAAAGAKEERTAGVAGALSLDPTLTEIQSLRSDRGVPLPTLGSCLPYLRGSGGLWKRSPVLLAGMTHCSSVVLRRADNRPHQLPGA